MPSLRASSEARDPLQGQPLARTLFFVRAPTTIVLFLGVAACSSTASAPKGGLTPGTATVDGTFTFMPAHYSASAAASQVDPQHVSILVASLRGTDSFAAVQMSAGANVAGVFQVVMAIESSDAKMVVAPGTYSLGNGWQASYRLTDQGCAAADQGAATKGSLEIDSVDTSIHGIADMTFPRAESSRPSTLPSVKQPVASAAGALARAFRCVRQVRAPT